MASVEPIIRGDSVKYRAIPWDAQNRKKGPTRSFEHESDAWAYARGWERDRDQVAEAFGAKPERNRRRVLFSDYALEYAKRAEGTAHTRRSRITHARVLGQHLAKLYIDEIDRARINELCAAMSNLSPGTRRNRNSFITRVFAEAVKDQLIAESPCRDLEKVRRVTLREHRIPTEDELSAIIRHMPDWFEVAILLAHDSGLRVSEVAGLRWFRLDLENRRVLVKDVMDKGRVIRAYPKGKESRVVPLSARTVAALRKAKMRQGAGDMDFVVRRPCGREFSAHALSAYWSVHIREVKLRGNPPTFHDLRHACAHRLVAAGVSMPVLQAFMGHKSLATTQIYMPGVTADAMAAALDRVPSPTTAPVVAIAGA